jgi:hypothetical protein
MPSYYRDPNAPAPNVPRRIGVAALIERDGTFLVERRVDDAYEWAFIVLSIAFRIIPRGDDEPTPSEESAGMRFVSRDELTRLPFWPAQQPIREAQLREPPAPVVE